jgi:hypothetical protein
MKLYCDKCFAKMEYKFSKPKFCTECGAKFESSVVSSVKKNTAEIPAAQVVEDSDNIKKIKYLESQLAALKRTNKSYRDDSDQSEFDQHEEEDDYLETQRHISNFKKIKNRSGVVVESDSGKNGITFGQILESSSDSFGGSANDFKMSNEKSKSKEQILEELRIEASSQARVIEID